MNQGSIRIQTKLDTEKLNQQIVYLKTKLAKTLKEISILEKTIAGGDYLEGTTEQLAKLRLEASKLRSEINRLETPQQKTFGDKGIKSLKRFSLALLGIRSAYMLIRKAVNSYLEDNEELSQQIQNIWKALGNALAPVIQYLVNALMYGIGYLNEFIKALTGVDIIANANAQALKKQADATKEATKQMYGFDEANVQSSTSSSTKSSGLIELPELNQSVVNNLKKVADYVKSIWNVIKDIGKWLGDNFGATGLIAVGLGLIIGKIALMIGTAGIGGTGLLAILAIMLAIYDAMKLVEIDRDLAKLKKTQKEIAEETGYIYNNTKKLSNEMIKGYDEAENKADFLNKQLVLFRGNVNDAARSNEKLSKTSIEMLLQETEFFEEMYKQGNLTVEQQEEYGEYLLNTINVIAKENEKTGEYTEELGRLKNTINEITQTPLTINANDKASSKLKSIINQLERITKYGNIDINIGSSNTYHSGGSGMHFATGGVIHKSALGSIVNNPGRGVAIGSNVLAGEAGREGVIPLTDPNAMTELGETIGRYITVNLTNITKLNARTISKETSRVNNEYGFATNGGQQ